MTETALLARGQEAAAHTRERLLDAAERLITERGFLARVGAALVLAWSLGAGAAAKDEAAPVLSGKLSLQDALKLALTWNRSLQSAIEEKAVASGRLQEAWGEAYPQVTLDARYERLAEVLSFEIVPGDPATLVQLGFLDNYSVELNISQTLYRGGQVAAGLRASKAYALLTDENVRDAVQRTIHDTVLAYYRVLLDTEQLALAQDTLRLSEAHLADTGSRRKFGVASDFNVLRSQVEVSNARVVAIRVKNALETSRADLMRVLGASQDSRVELTDTLTYHPVTAVEEQAIEEALRSRPDLAAADLAVKLQRELTRITLGDYFPKVDAYFTDTYANPDPVLSTVDDWANTWTAGVTLRMTVFDGPRRSGRLGQERAMLRQREIEATDARERAVFEVRQAVLDLQASAEAVESQQLTVDQANEGLRLAEVGYREGTLDQVAVLEARSALTQAKALYFNSLYAHAASRLELQRATGTLGPRVAPADSATGPTLPD